MTGKLIVIDGIDGSGKGTQTKRLVRRLRDEDYSVETISFPQHGKRSCTMVDDYLMGKFGTPEQVGPYSASSFYALDRFAASFKMRKWMNQGKIIISDLSLIHI